MALSSDENLESSNSKTKSNSQSKTKRSWADEVEQAEIIQKKLNVPFTGPRFLVLSAPNQDLSKVSPFLIQKGLQGIGGSPKSVKKLRSGDLLIEVTTPTQVKSFLSAKAIGHIEIKVTAHSTLNASRGVISEIDLINCTEEEIKSELSDQGVVNVKRITIKRDNNIIPTKHLILTFNTSTLPKYVIAGYLNCSIRPYVPNPMRCFKCQKFGHTKTSCRGQETCSRCGETGHPFTECSKEPKCINCQGSHSANSKNCPKWVLEKQIQSIKVKNNVSYPEARKIAQTTQPTNKTTYAAATKKSVKSIETQTTISVPPNRIYKRRSMQYSKNL